VIADWHQRFDWFIEQAGKHGMYVILDFHGAPGSQNGSDHSGVDGGDNKEAASEFFFGDEEIVSQNQELFYKIWELIASRYLDNPVVAGYDLLNEPFCTYRYNSSYSESELHQIYWKVYDEAYKRIREIDPKHVIIMEATWDPKDLPDPKLYGWENVMYQYHNYLYDDYNNEAGKQIQNMKKKINLIKAAHYDVPSYMGEFNYFNSYEAWDEGLALLNESDLHWTIWTYKTVIQYKNWGLYNQSVGELNIETATLERIKTFYGTVDSVMPNKKLIEISSKHFRESF
jgi:endoglucanase